MGRLLLPGLLIATACGRLGFDSPEPSLDATDIEPLVKCGEPPRFQVGAATLRELDAIATANGFVLFATDTNKDLRGWAFEWNADVLEPTVQNVVIDGDITGAFGATAIGNDILLAAVHGTGMAGTLGTTYHLLDHAFAARGAAVDQPSRVIGAVPLAQWQSHLASIRLEAGSVAVHAIGLDGVDGSMRVVGGGGQNPSEPSLAVGGPAFAATWVAGMPTPNNTQLALLDTDYAVVKGPVTITNTTGFDTIRPRVHWAPMSNTYAVAWFEKTPTGEDDVYVQVFDAALQPLFAPKLVSTYAVRPRLSTDGTGFFLAYHHYDVDRMEVVHVLADGTLTPRTIGTSGGTPNAWAIVERAGQPVLVYAEAGGSGPDLWFDAMCL